MYCIGLLSVVGWGISSLSFGITTLFVGRIVLPAPFLWLGGTRMGGHICRPKDAEALDECGERYLKRGRVWVTVRCLLCRLRVFGARVVG